MKIKDRRGQFNKFDTALNQFVKELLNIEITSWTSSDNLFSESLPFDVDEIVDL